MFQGLDQLLKGNIFAYIILIINTIVYLALLFLIIYIIMIIISWMIEAPEKRHKHEAIKHLRQRFEKGEISKEDFEKKKEDIMS